MALKLKVHYGYDHLGVTTAFYWPGSNQKRGEVLSIKRTAPDTFESTYQGRPGQREGSIFLAKDFVFYIPPESLSEGIANENVKKFVQHGHMIVQAWDTAYDETKNSAWSVCITALLVPCDKYHRGEDPLTWGPCDVHFDVYILNVYREKVDIGDLVMEIRSQFNRWHPDIVIIENRASGISAIQALRNSDIPVHPVPAELGKRARAIQGVGAGSAQGWFRRHRVYLPTVASWKTVYITEMKDFSGADDGISDQVDATVHLLRYAIIAGAQTSIFPTAWTPERGTPLDDSIMIDGGEAQRVNPNALLLTMLGELPNMDIDPFGGLCGRCNNFKGSWCAVHKMNKAAIDSCIYYTDRVAGNG